MATRKKPFSAKQKKAQIQDKRARNRYVGSLQRVCRAPVANAADDRSDKAARLDALERGEEPAVSAAVSQWRVACAHVHGLS